MDFWSSLFGMVELELTSADPTGALSAINAAGITLYHTRQKGDLTLCFRMERAEYQRLVKLAQRRGEVLRFSKHRGMYWMLRRLLSRPVLLAGLALVLFLTFFLPTRVLFVQVEGNGTIPTRLILSEAENCGIAFGASRRQVRSERMKNALLQAIPELQWAGINTYGCTAVISVRERKTTETVPEEQRVSSIVAAREGVITEITVLKGNSVCRVGQAVKPGQLLVSGYTDCGICIQATQAQAEIFAETQRSLSSVTLSNFASRGESTGSERKISLIIGKKQINFYKDSGISDTTCDKMYKVNYLTLPGGFVLPVALVTQHWVYYDQMDERMEQSRAAQILSDFAENYLTEKMIAGKILDRTELLSQTDESYCQSGKYICLEMIAKTRFEESIYNYEAD